MKESNNNLKILGQNIRNIRKNKGLSIEQLSFECQLSRNYISDVERGKRNISFINLNKISKALNVNIKELLDNIF